MLLTRRILNEILRGWRIWYIPAELKKELLEEFGNPCIDDEGHLHDYTEQDICEHLRKILRPFESQYHDKDHEGGWDSATLSAKSSYNSGQRTWAGCGQTA